MKEQRKIIIIFFAIIAGLVTAWVIWGNITSKNFKKSEIHSVIVKSDDWWGRMIQFIFTDRSSFYAMQPVNNKIQVGDSVSKKANSTILKIYRESVIGVFEFHIYYDTDKYDYYTLSGTTKIIAP